MFQGFIFKFDSFDPQLQKLFKTIILREKGELYDESTSSRFTHILSGNPSKTIKQLQNDLVHNQIIWSRSDFSSFLKGNDEPVLKKQKVITSINNEEEEVLKQEDDEEKYVIRDEEQEEEIERLKDVEDDDDEEEKQQIEGQYSENPYNDESITTNDPSLSILSSTETQDPDIIPLNQHLIEPFQLLITLNNITLKQNKQFRNRAFNQVNSYLKITQAISIFKKLDFRIHSSSQLFGISGIGKGIIDRVDQILKTGTLVEISGTSRHQVVLNAFHLFLGVYGVGHAVALDWIKRGYLNLDQAVSSGTLNRAQLIGVKYYDDLSQRIPRNEVEHVEKFIRDALFKIDSGAQSHVMGSYLRGKSTCGDIDVLLTHPNGFGHKNLIESIIHILEKDYHFYFESLASSSIKYMGVCRVAQGMYRRIDFIAIPFKEFGAACLYFCGDGDFNRQLRWRAHINGMKLNQKGLFTRDGGQLLASHSEKDIFRILQVPYLEPNQRNADAISSLPKWQPPKGSLISSIESFVQ